MRMGDFSLYLKYDDLSPSCDELSLNGLETQTFAVKNGHADLPELT